MLVLRLWLFLTGYLVIRIRGASPETFINLCTDQGIDLWYLRWDDDDLTGWVAVTDLRRLRPVVRRSGCRVRIRRRAGLPFLLRRAETRGMLLIGTAVFVLLLYAVSTFIWSVDVRGVETLEAGEVEEELAALGLHRGVWKGRIQPQRIARQLPFTVDRITRASVEIRGTRALVQIVERAPEPERRATRPGDVVAGKSGVIVDILVLAGRPVTRQGETVDRGQRLISGDLSGWRQEPEDGPDASVDGSEAPEEERRLVRARGAVQARVGYREYVEVPHQEVRSRRTGALVEQWVLRFGERSVVARGDAEIPYEEYQTEHTVARTWRIGALTGELLHLRHYEVVQYARSRSSEEAAEAARRQALEAIRERMADDARIVSRRHRTLIDTGERIGVEVVVTAVEDIGVVEPMPDPGPPEGAGPPGRSS